MSDDPLDKLELLISDVALRQQYSLQNRTSLLTIHSLKAMIIGPCVLWWGVPESFRDTNFEVIIIVASMIFAVGGLMLWYSLFLASRGWMIVQFVAMLMLIQWDIWMVISFTSAWKEGTLSNPYPIVLYTCLAGFICIHIRTLSKFIQQGLR